MDNKHKVPPSQPLAGVKLGERSLIRDILERSRPTNGVSIPVRSTNSQPLGGITLDNRSILRELLEGRMTLGDLRKLT